MNPGIVFGIGFIAGPIVALATFAIARARCARDPSGWAVIIYALSLVMTFGAAVLATNVTPCGSTGGDGRWQWRGTACVDTKAVQR